MLFIYVLAVFFAYAIVSIIKFRSFGLRVFTPMLLSMVFLVALTINIQDSAAYLDSHPGLNGNQVGWFPGYWPLPFLAALLIVSGTPLYLGHKRRKDAVQAKASK